MREREQEREEERRQETWPFENNNFCTAVPECLEGAVTALEMGRSLLLGI